MLALLALLARQPVQAQDTPERLDRGRFTFLFFPQDRQLASSFAEYAIASDTFPGLPRPVQKAIIAIAPDERRFRQWAGNAPEWGAAVAFPDTRRIVMRGRSGASEAGDPIVVLRHELAHLALHEYLGDLPPRWFDEGYASFAAGEWGRQEILSTNVSLLLRGMPTLEELEGSFRGGATAAQWAYALAHRAVAELAYSDRERGLSLFLQYWKQSGSMERALRQAYGLTTARFEAQWSQRTRRQYGLLALFGNLTLAMVILLVVLTPLYISRRRRDRERLARMKAADAAAERAEQQSAIEALLREVTPDDPR